MKLMLFFLGLGVLFEFLNQVSTADPEEFHLMEYPPFPGRSPPQ